MKISDKGINLIKEFEGWRLEAYKCPAGVWTIGYGHTGKVDGKEICKGMKITSSKAISLLKDDLVTFEKAVENCKALTFKPNQNQFDALVSFAFNCGEGSLNTLVKNRPAETVSEKMLLYNKAAGKELPGLTRRRKEEKALFDKPVATKSKATIEKGNKIRIKKGAKDLNTKGTYASWVYDTTYIVHSVKNGEVVFGNGAVVVGKTKKNNCTIV